MNIGKFGTHSTGEFNYKIKLDNDFKVEQEPTSIVCNSAYDKHHFKKHINRKTPLSKRALNKVLRILKLK